MAKRFLTDINLAGNQLINATFEKLTADPITGNFEGRLYYNTASDILKLYDGTSWIAVGAITNVQGTTDEVEVSVVNGVATISLPSTINANTTGNAATATKLATTRAIELSGDVTGTANFDGSAAINISTTIAANSVALGTDTTGDYVATIGGTDGVSITGTGTESRAVTVANTDKGSSQNIFKNVAVDGTTVVADNNDDTLTIAGGTGITVAANATTDTVTITNAGVTSIAGTANQITASGSTGSVTLSLPSAVTFPGTVTLNADPSQALHAATKQYVDGIASGIDWHQAVHLLAASNVALTGTSGTLIIDSHAALDDADDGYRILLKNQTTDSEDGIYVYADDGTTYTLSRSTDADNYGELVGSAVFIMEGTIYGATSWMQSNHYLTSFAGQTWIQFSGTGTYVAGNGLALTGNSFAINTGVTVDVNSIQSLTNKTLTSPTITNPTVSGLYLSDNNIVIEGTADSFETTLTFTDPTADRTITFKDASGTVAYTADITTAIDALTTSDIEEGTRLYFTDERAQDAVGTIISGSNSLSAVYTDATPSIAFDTTLATTSYMSKTSGLAVDISAVETKLTTDGYTKKVSASVGNSTNTSFAVTHSLGTRDVQVQVYDNATYDTVEVDVIRTGTNTVTVSFASAPATDAYRVVIIG
jgi:hypothetical protein